MHAAAAAGQLHIVKVLIEKYKVSPDSKDTVSCLIDPHITHSLAEFSVSQAGYQPLHMAASNGHIDVAEYLVTECKVPVECVSDVCATCHMLYPTGY